MSADSSHMRPEMRSSGPCVITPQTVTDPSILDNVAGFINDVVPTAYNVLPQDTKDQIQWAHFEQFESDDPSAADYDNEKIIPPALLLVLGYSNGIQVWAIPANGEASEIFSWRHGSVRVLKVLPNPFMTGPTDIEDNFANKRPLIALCESSIPGAQFCSVSFLSLKTGEQVKVIKFKNPVLDILANKKSVVVTFSEKIAIFDAFTLEDRLSVTTCYLSPGLQPNPIALGPKWMAYAEKKLIHSKRSSGGNEGEGVQSYTATVLHAAKSLGRGLRELGESVASSLTGNQTFKPGTSPNSPQSGTSADISQKGIVTILNIEDSVQHIDKSGFPDPIMAHFAAHTEAIVCLQFDPSGLLLLTADKRGHDFHLFRIHPHPAGPSLAAVHHLYVLHRGDTTARVQDMCFSPDSRWVAVSTLRGTTHVFPVTPYGGNVGLRTHGTPHVVNKMSRFHRSAGLTAEGRSNSPVSLLDIPVNSHFPYNNPRFPPFPHPTVLSPLAQIRQPVYTQNIGTAPPRQSTGRQRIPSSSEENIALRVATCFAPPRAWIESASVNRESGVTKSQIKAVESIFVMSCNGCLVQYDLDPHHSTFIPKERVCDDSPIELTVTAKAQWVLQRQPNHIDVPLPLTLDNLNIVVQDALIFKKSKPDHNDDSWLSQVEIVTHAGPHRRLWMGPQFTFKTYTTTNGSPLSMTSMAEALPIDLRRSKPVNMPITKANAVLIESSSASSCEQSLLDNYQKAYEEPGGPCEIQLKEDLADAMQESPFIRETGGRCVIVSMKPHASSVAKVVNPLGTVVTVQSDDETEVLDVSDDVVILENCDEALFRPVVTPKPVHYTEYKPKTYSADNIITKSLESTTEVTVKILSKSNKAFESPPTTTPIVKPAVSTATPVVKTTTNSVGITTATPVVKPTAPSFVKSTACVPKSRESSPKPAIKVKTEKQTVNKINKEIKASIPKAESPPPEALKLEVKEKPKIDSKFICDFSDPFDIPEPNTQSKYKDKLLEISVPEPLDCNLLTQEIKNDDNFLSKLLENDPLTDNTSTKNNVDDLFESSLESSNSSGKNNKDSKTYSKLKKELDILTSDEPATEEKSFSKKPRKPKAKLGVKIANVNKENLEKNLDDCAMEITLPAPPKRSWSSVASSKPTEQEKILIDSTEKEKEAIFDPMPIESIEHFSVTLPKKTYSTAVVLEDLININTPDDDKVDICSSESMNNSANSDDNLLKIDKSSDDEKADTGSSPTETTESDDSGKAPPEIDSNDADETTSTKPNAPMSRASKRKLKKKRK